MTLSLSCVILSRCVSLSLSGWWLSLHLSRLLPDRTESAVL